MTNQMTNRSKRILYGITGGIAAYKAPEILHGWVKLGYEVETILTEAAEAFVSPMVLSTLSKRRVWRDRDFLSDEYGWKIPHISLTNWADVFVIAPCTANILHVAASGDGSTLLGASIIANTKPLLIFPAMNCNMLANPSVRANIKLLEERGAVVADPDSGILACGYEGKGRLPSADVINDYVKMMLCTKKDFKGKRVVVTAGPTHEYIDPVRYISNPSTGKMGYAIARAAWDRGAHVTLITGPTSLVRPAGMRIINITSAEDMYNACMDASPTADIIIKAAAVGDYRVANPFDRKIKRNMSETLTLELKQNKDIAAALGKIKMPGQILVGFAAETNDIIENAQRKLAEKRLDMIVSNDVSKPGAGFAVDTNDITIMAVGAEPVTFSGTKEDAANCILDAIVAYTVAKK